MLGIIDRIPHMPLEFKNEYSVMCQALDPDGLPRAYAWGHPDLAHEIAETAARHLELYLGTGKPSVEWLTQEDFTFTWIAMPPEVGLGLN